MNRLFHYKRQPLTVTDKQAGVGNYSTDQKKFTGHMFNIKLEEKSQIKWALKLCRLKYSCEKTNRRERSGGYKTRGR